MSEATSTADPSVRDDDAASDGSVDLGNYEIIRRRLLAQAKQLGERAEALNQRRQETFGGTELTVIGNLRVRTENNCVPRDIVHIGGLLLFGYNVVHGLRKTQLDDVLALHKLTETPEGLELPAVGLDAGGRFLQDSRFTREFDELVEYYKDATLLQLRADETKLLAVFQIGASYEDVRVFRWSIDPTGQASYIDNRGERDHVYPATHDFEWKKTTADMHVRGRHPHINIEDEIFVETIGGDLTIKVEDNTESGSGIYDEPVENANQSLDDADILYARLGTLILLKILPYREQHWRYIVYNSRSKTAVRLDDIGQACIELPEDHGIVFPGGYYLQTGDYKVFDSDHKDLVFMRAIRSPNGEDVMYVFHQRMQGAYVLYPYNLVRKEVQSPIYCNGYSIFDDGRMVVFRHATDDPTRVHPMRVWQTPFVSAEFAAAAPTDGSPMATIGNAELVRGISDCFTLQRLVEGSDPNRQVFEDLISTANRIVDAYAVWLGREDFGSLRDLVDEIRRTSELIIDEFEKVQQLRKTASDALSDAEEKQRELTRALRPDSWDRIERFLDSMTRLRNQRGHLITLKELRYIDLDRLDELEQESVAAFDKVSAACVTFLLGGTAFEPLLEEIGDILERIPYVEKATDAVPLTEKIDALNEGLNLLAEVVSGLEVDDATQRTAILEQISEVFGQVNRVRAALQSQRKSLLSSEGKAEFVAQFKLFGQAVSSALALCDSPERCDDQLSRLLVQLEELEGRFSEFDEFLADLAEKREEVYDAFSTRKQTLLDERNRRVQNLVKAAERIVQGIQRRARSFKNDDELNTYFASDPMVHKLRQLSEQLMELGDSVKADEVQARLKSARQDALRGLRDKKELFAEGDNLIKFGRHLFSVNTQPLELTMVPREDEDGEPRMAIHLTGTDFYEIIDDEAFNQTRPFWQQTAISENKQVYRGEYLAASILFDAEAGRNGLSLDKLHDASREEGGGLLNIVRQYASERYEEGYERGLHDADAAAILDKLLILRDSAGLLRFAPTPRALACLFWAFDTDRDARALYHRRAQSLGRLRHAFSHSPAFDALSAELAERIATFCAERGIDTAPRQTREAGRYLFEELCDEKPTFSTSAEAVKLKDGLYAYLDGTQARRAFEADLETVRKDVGRGYALMRAWLEALVAHKEELDKLGTVVDEAAALLMTERQLEREVSQVLTSVDVDGLLGNHPRVQNQVLHLRLDEFTERLGHFKHEIVPGYKRYRELRNRFVETERRRLRIDEFMPRVMTAFVRNKLINEVYLPLIGDNLAKQIGASGETKRTDLMGLLLLVSPPGYGKTTLMEYVASRLGLVFMKINGPALGHAVHSIDPAEAPNATARQEVEKINLAFEMGNNVMLYLDDIQHTHPELLQKFISLCDAQRRIEGVWKGRTRTYDFRGKKFCVVMAGNPYTESGEKFQIPDMLANRADTYNLGDVLSGREHVFALSYLENSLTSNPVLAPLAARDYDDVYKIIRMAQGEQVATTELSHGYSGVELQEIIAVFKRLFVCQDTLLKVNQTYIEAASMDDNFRTEPRFQLQGSYRNMNKLAEKVVAAMNDAELDALVTDHYVGEAQTLTSGAEANLLKLAEMRGRLTPEKAERWEQIKRDFRRIKLMGGRGDDPVSRVTGTLGGLGAQLEHIRDAIGSAVSEMKTGTTQHALQPVLRNIEKSIASANIPKQDQTAEQLKALSNLLGEHLPALARAQIDAARTANDGQTGLDKLAAWLAPALDKLTRPQLEVAVHTEPPAGIDELLAQQVAIVERTLVPLVRTTTKNLEDGAAISRKLDELILLLQQADLQIQAGQSFTLPESPDGRSGRTPASPPAAAIIRKRPSAQPQTPETADTQKMPAIPPRED